jgi:hypothetical protein
MRRSVFILVFIEESKLKYLYFLTWLLSYYKKLPLTLRIL